jgi:hypothetical protein
MRHAPRRRGVLPVDAARPQGGADASRPADRAPLPKPDYSRVRRALLTYTARAHEHGDSLLNRSRGDYLTEPGHAAELLRRDLAKAVGHLMEALDALELGDTQGRDPHSGLPHVAHAAARLNMALGRAVHDGTLPADPCHVSDLD